MDHNDEMIQSHVQMLGNMSTAIDRIDRALLGTLEKPEDGFIYKTNTRIGKLESFKNSWTKVNWLFIGAIVASAVGLIFGMFKVSF
jgi:hypothetical protein